MRYTVEPEIGIAKGCRCCSCWENTGQWLVIDTQSDAKDLVFSTEAEAITCAADMEAKCQDQ